MNEQDRKFLTEHPEILNECWHENPKFIGVTDILEFPRYECSKCGESVSKDCATNRTFGTPQDAYDLEQVLEKKNLWDEFDIWFNDNQDFIHENLKPKTYWHSDIISYMKRIPEQRCQLICDFLKEVER